MLALILSLLVAREVHRLSQSTELPWWAKLAYLCCAWNILRVMANVVS